MGIRKRRNRMEMIFVVAMVVLCGSLTVLQYRWTGALAEAEMARVTGALADQLKRVARDFDAELTRSRAALVPGAEELAGGSPESVHLRKLRRWKATNPRPVFKRIAVALPADGDVELYGIDIAAEHFTPMAWPTGWEMLRHDIEEKLRGGPPPHADGNGTIFEAPVMRGPQSGPRDPGPDFGGGPGGPRGGEREWIIMELDTTYLARTWLPELVATYLNTGGTVVYDVTVKSKATGGTIFTTLSAGAGIPGKSAAVDLNFQGAEPGNPRGRPAEPLWTMTAGRRGGTLEAAVAISRRRNLAVAVLLNGLIVAAGVMLLRATRHSRDLAEEQMRFVANVTHELRTPLTVIRGAAHNLKRGIVKDPDGIAKYTGLIIEHADSLNAMVDQVLEFSGGRRAISDGPSEPVDIAAELRAAVQAIADDPKYSACQMECGIPGDLPAVSGDAGALRRAFANLIENAAKHGGSGGWIGITAAARGSRVEVTVADRGPGIPAAEMEGIFAPFFRGGEARSRETRGSGLGLSLVREIAAAHGGSVSAANGAGGGAVFTFTIPVQPTP